MIKFYITKISNLISNKYINLKEIYFINIVKILIFCIIFFFTNFFLFKYLRNNFFLNNLMYFHFFFFMDFNSFIFMIIIL